MSCRDHPDAPKWTKQLWIDYLQRGSDKNRFQYCFDSNGYLLYMRAIQGHSGGHKVDPSLQDNIEIPHNWVDHIYHVGSSHDCHFIIQWGLVAGGKRYKRRKANSILHISWSHERTTRGWITSRDTTTTGPLQNQMESVPERDMSGQFGKWSRQRIGILANPIQCYHPS